MSVPACQHQAHVHGGLARSTVQCTRLRKRRAGACQQPCSSSSSPLHQNMDPCTSSRAVHCNSSENPVRLADEEYMKEYAQLKSTLLENTRKSGAAIAAYMLLTVDGQAALCALIGMGFSNSYLQWLFRDVDAVQPTDRVPMMEAKQVESPVLRALAIWAASYKHSLTPRLLVPVSLAALMAAYNNVSSIPLTGFQEASLLLGFLSHKVALILKVVDELSPKEYSQDTGRPTIEKIEDGEGLELDRWGRPKKAQYTLPTEALPEDVDPDNMGLLPSLLGQAALRVDAAAAESSEPAAAAPQQQPRAQRQQRQGQEQ